jgi:hypothetical protein
MSAECANCGTTLAGDYCHVCGQKVAHLKLGLHDFLHEAAHEFLHFDGKIVRTLKALFLRPGELTREFVAGRRARYISPIRLYLIVSAIFFFLAATHGAETGMVEVHSGPPPKGTTNVARTTPRNLDSRFERGAKKYDGHPEQLAEDIAHAFPKAMFILMPIFALLVMLVERRKQPLYIPHLYFAIHYHAFAFSVMSFATLLGIPHIAIITMLSKVMLLVIFVHLHLALRRVYGDSRLAALMKTIAISVVYGVCVVGAMMVILFAFLAT